MTVELFDDIPWGPDVRERFLPVFNQAMRRYHRGQVLWMSSEIIDRNIMSLLPKDLSRCVSRFV
jgi:hypothetical protein